MTKIKFNKTRVRSVIKKVHGSKGMQRTAGTNVRRRFSNPGFYKDQVTSAGSPNDRW